MSDNGSNMQPVRPLTRREIREREQAAAAERAAQGGSASQPTASSGRPGGGQGPVAPARPADPPPSRRALRESTGPTEQAAQPTVVRPPAASGGMRGLDETGRLTPVRETAERHTIRPPATAPSPAGPNRTSARPAAGWQRPTAPGASGPVRPPTPAPGAFGPPSGGVRGQDPAGPARTTASPASPDQPQRTSAFGGPAGAPAAPRTDAPSPWGAGRADAPTSRQSAPAPAPAPAPPAAEPSGPDLPWAAITSGSAPERASGGSADRASAPASPFPTTSAAPGAHPAEPGDDLFPRVAQRAEPEEEVDDSPRGPSYTWLHYLVLVAVAFVLGLLVWELISRDDPGPAAEALAAATVVTAEAADVLGPLDPGR
jgi:hypothetical protein